MKHRSLPLLLSFSMIVFLISCGSNDTKTSADTKTDSTASTTTTEPASSAPASTIVNSPTNMLVVIHKVSNYDKWKTSFDGHDTARVANGIHNYVIGRGLEDSNNVLVAFKIDDSAKAKGFLDNPSLKDAMKKGGVTGKPTIHFVTMVWQDTSKASSDLRSRTTFTVKDFDNWRKAFESQKHVRMDNGITYRAFGYDMKNHNNVTLVVVINDTAKAKAFWKSDQLKKLRAASGTISQPERFLYRVTKRY